MTDTNQEQAAQDEALNTASDELEKLRAESLEGPGWSIAELENFRKRAWGKWTTGAAMPNCRCLPICCP